MTAAWCVTCLVNERIALSSDAVKQAFAERKSRLSQGRLDPRSDPAIYRLPARAWARRRAALRLFPPKEPTGRPAAVLTASAVLAELDRFGS